MKKIFAIATLITGTLMMVSCGDDDGGTVASEVSIAGIPASASLAIDGTLSVTAEITAEAGIASFVVTVNGGTAADILPAAAAGETSASVVVSGTVADLGLVIGANTLVFTLTDVDGNSDDFTHVLTVADFPEVEVFASEDGIGADNVTWTADNVYVLRGFVFVNEGQTLTIDPGTVIKGQAGQGSGASALIVARGGTINAVGTAALPIVFTSTSDDLSPANIVAGSYASPNLDPDVQGLWGGLIVLGNATISASATEVQIEGIPTSEERGLYGGSTDADDSGDIAYVSVRHAGTNIGSGNEINGITFGAVGSGTTVAHIEVVANADDGIEWFGGDVDVSNVLIWNVGDDGLDTDQDWIGTCSDFIIVTPNGSAFELDGPEGAGNRGVHTFTDGTVYAGTDIDHLVDFDGSTNAELQNMYFYGWDADYGFIQDEDPDEAGDQNFNPIESFGGDGNGTNSAWEYTLATGTGAADAAEIFAGVDTGVITSVNTNANTVGGPAASNFAWTFAGSAGALTDIGL
ncbi:hypothetical protein [Ekhidna sp.]